MQDSRLYQLFQCLNTSQHKAIQKAVLSPFFNTREDVAALWQLLCADKSAAINKENVFTSLYPNSDFEAQKLNIVMNKLLDLIERVLVFTAVEDNEIEQKINLSQQYKKMGLAAHFLSVSKEIIAFQAKDPKKDSHFYQKAYQLEQIHYEFNAKNRTSELNLQELNDSLDLAFMVEKLRQNCNLLSHQAVYSKEYDAGLLDAVFQRIKDKPELLVQHPTLRIYFHCYWSLKNPSELVHFQQFRTDLLTLHTLFSESDIRDLYLLAINFCIKKNNSGEVDFARQGLVLYKTALEKGFLLENNILSRFTYHNIVAWALLQKDFAWTAHFIDAYKNRLERSYRDSMYSFCLAKLEYSRHNYEAVIALLQRAEYRDTLLALAAKTILMKIYYETDEFEALEAHLSSMRAYLSRKRVMGYHKTNYQNIIKYTKKLLENAGMSNAVKAQNPDSVTLREAIEKEEILTEKEWLLSQL